MRFHEPVLGVIRRRNDDDGSNINGSHLVINTTASSTTNRVTSRNENFFYSDNGNENFPTSEKCLKTLKSIIHEKDSENFSNNCTKTNNFDYSRDVNCVTNLETFLKLKTNSCGYFKNFLDIDDCNHDLNGNSGGNDDNVILIETLNLTEDNLSRVSLISGL